MKSHAGTSHSHSWWNVGGGREILSITNAPPPCLDCMEYTLQSEYLDKKYMEDLILYLFT